MLKKKTIKNFLLINHFKKQNEYKKYPFLFSKYILNLSQELSLKNTNYQIEKKTEINTSKFIAHLNCYNLDQFDEIYENYIYSIKKIFNVIITFSICNFTNEIKNNENFNNTTIIKVSEKGSNIGAKIILMNYLNNLNLKLENNYFILFLDSNQKVRNMYFDSLINNIYLIKNLINKNNYGMFVPPFICSDNKIVLENEKIFINSISNNLWSKNSLIFINEMYQYFNIGIETKNCLFPISNSYFLSYDIANELFQYEFYNLLNSFNKNDFDPQWVRNKYDINSEDINVIFDKFKNNTLQGSNNIYNSYENQLEDVFNKIIFSLISKLNKEIYILSLTENKISINNNLKIANFINNFDKKKININIIGLKNIN